MERKASYSINLETLFSPLERIDLTPLVERVRDPWYNQTLCQVNDAVVRLAVIQGEFHMHKHDRQDEFFYVVEGEVVIEVEGRAPTPLKPRQGITIPKGIMHRPIAERRSVLLLVERADVKPTGD
jgi:mannose-6-phosphate isomerase-like protein (cupin superfamily)